MRSLLLIGVLLLFASSAADSRGLTVEEVLRLAAVHSPGPTAAAERIEDLERMVFNAEQSQKPVLDIDYETRFHPFDSQLRHSITGEISIAHLSGWKTSLESTLQWQNSSWDTSYGLQLSVPLYGQVPSSHASRLDQTQLEWDTAQQRLHQAAATAQIEVLDQLFQLDILTQQITHLQQRLGVLEDKYNQLLELDDVGGVEDTSLIEAENELRRAALQLQQAQGRWQAQKDHLTDTLDLSHGTELPSVYHINLKLDESKFRLDEAAFFEHALSVNEAALKVRQAEYDQKLDRISRDPKIALQARGDDSQWSISLTGTYEFRMAQEQTVDAVERAEEALAVASADSKRHLQSLEQELSDRYMEWEISQVDVELAQLALSQAALQWHQELLDPDRYQHYQDEAAKAQWNAYEARHRLQLLWLEAQVALGQSVLDVLEVNQR